MSSTGSTPAPGPLETVRRFINTLDIEAGTDSLDTGADLRQWLADAALPAPPATVSRGDLARARELREALRAAATANHTHANWPSDAVAAVNRTGERARLAVSFGPERTWAFTVRATAVDGALGQLVAIVADAMTDGTWARLKVCASDACRWAFYDASRAGTGKWCTMRLCGNRAKQDAWRNRQTD